MSWNSVQSRQKTDINMAVLTNRHNASRWRWVYALHGGREKKSEGSCCRQSENRAGPWRGPGRMIVSGMDLSSVSREAGRGRGGWWLKINYNKKKRQIPIKLLHDSYFLFSCIANWQGFPTWLFLEYEFSSSFVRHTFSGYNFTVFILSWLICKL